MTKARWKLLVLEVLGPLCALGLPANASGGEDAAKTEQPEQGEVRLDPGGQKAVLEKIKAAFEQHPCVRAEVTKTVVDPLGLLPETEQGELLIKRPDKILRRFSKNGTSFKAVLVRGQSSLTYNAATKKVVEKDYSRAPRRLALVRASGTGDLETLQLYYDVLVFEKSGQDGKQWRLVFHRRRGDLPYDRLQARITEGQALFSEIRYEYRAAADGDNKTETFTAIKSQKQLSDEDFNDPLFKSPKAPKEEVEELKVE